MIRLGFSGYQHALREWDEKYKGTVVSNFPDGTSRFAIPTGSEYCDRLIDELLVSRFPIDSFNFSWGQLGFDWSCPEPYWAGARLRAGDDSVRLSPDNEFSPAFPAPCYGLIPPYLPARITNRPRQHVVSTKLDAIFSTTMCDFISSRATCDFAPVIGPGSTLGSHRRIILEARHVLVPQGFRNSRCAVCGTPMAPDVGIFFGRRMDDSLICESKQGRGHLGLERAYCVSVPSAQELRKSIRAGYGLDPILDIESALAARILNLLSRLEHLNFSTSPTVPLMRPAQGEESR
jgi:hypothetical protein